MRTIAIAGALLMAAVSSVHAEERAWLAVETAEVQWDDGLRIAVKIKNVGAVPAIDMVAAERVGAVSRTSGQIWYEAFPRDTLSPVCPSSVSNAGILWQTIPQAYRVSIDALERTPKTPFIHGCFAYRSKPEGRTHLTEYCFMFSNGKALRCPWGNSAE